MADLEARLRTLLASDTDPYLGTDLVSAGAVAAIECTEESAAIRLELGFPLARYGEELRERLQRVFAGVGVPVTIALESRIVSHEVQKGTKPLPEIRNIIAVASGKGGVGKSTTAANLAIALQQEGGKVGVLDADIYGPSQPRMLASQGRPDSRDGKSMEPRLSYGLQTISIGNLIEEDTPMIWRGPMVTGALEQLLNETRWHDLDYLVVDLPPGTGDIQLTLCQRIPVSGAVIVTTPQDIALLEKVNVPVLGIVENMSVHVCSNCGHAEHIFGAGGGASMAAQYGVDLLGSLPLDIAIREGVDNGRPTTALEPDSPIAEIYRQIARRIAAKLAMRARDYSARFPKIVIQNT
jgi:ATP-binding protein involved in chromosome partitioning